MKQDILNDLRAFFLEGGMLRLIHEFRNPVDGDGIPDGYKHYDQATDSIIDRTPKVFSDQFGGPQFSDYSTMSFLHALSEKLNTLKAEILPAIKTIRYNLRIEQEGTVEMLNRHLNVIEEDIMSVRTEIMNIPELANYNQILNIFFEELIPYSNTVTSKRRKDNDKKNTSKSLSNGTNSLIKSETVSKKYETFELLNKNFGKKKLYNGLVAPTPLIDKITLEDFDKLFSGKKENIVINWLGQINQLNYLIKQLIEKKVIHNYGAWKSATCYFTSKGKDISTLKGANRIGKDARERIDDILPATK